MTRREIIQKLEKSAPYITRVTGTMDMGFEFSAVVPGGVINAEPGMLLDYSGGEWPLLQWEGKSDSEQYMLLKNFLINEHWTVTTWAELSDEELEQWLEDVSNAKSADKGD